MNTKQHPIPPFVEHIADFERIRIQAAAYGINRAQLPSNELFRLGPALAAAMVSGLAICALASAQFASKPDQVKSAYSSQETRPFAEQIERNTEALKRSRAWWQGYGRRNLQAWHCTAVVAD